MSFPFNIFLTQQHTNIKQKISCRKEEELRLSRNPKSCKAEKASVSASRKKKTTVGSVTIEAIICLPMFIYAAICLMWTLEFQVVGTTIRCAMQEAGRQAAEEMYQFPVVRSSKLESDIVSSIGAGRLDNSLVVGGRNGIHCEQSFVHMTTGILEMKTWYEVKLPFAHLGIASPRFEEKMRFKGWTGYVKDGLQENMDVEMVFITPSGTVYHRSRDCSYLNPSIKSIGTDEIEGLRNKDGSKYYPCEDCGAAHAGGQVCVTDYGEKYHTSKNCSAIKRKIYEVPITSVKGRRECSKCGR